MLSLSISKDMSGAKPKLDLSPLQKKITNMTASDVKMPAVPGPELSRSMDTIPCGSMDNIGSQNHQVDEKGDKQCIMAQESLKELTEKTEQIDLTESRSTAAAGLLGNAKLCSETHKIDLDHDVGKNSEPITSRSLANELTKMNSIDLKPSSIEPVLDYESKPYLAPPAPPAPYKPGHMPSLYNNTVPIDRHVPDFPRDVPVLPEYVPDSTKKVPLYHEILDSQAESDLLGLEDDSETEEEAASATKLG